MRDAPEENRNRVRKIPKENEEARSEKILESLQFLAGLEAYGFSGRNADFLAGARIAADAGLARAHVEHTEAPQFDSFAFAESVLHGFKDGLDGLFGLGAAYSGLVYDRVYDVQLDHSDLLPVNGKLC
jgi:hypothetical protein